MVSGQAQQPGPYPMYQPVYQPPHRGASDYIRSAVSDVMIGIVIVVGLFFMWLGSLIAGLTDDLDTWKLGQALNSFGMLATTAGLLLGGILRADMERWVRVALIVSAALLIMTVGYWPASWPF